jgi:hypothetical protein
MSADGWFLMISWMLIVLLLTAAIFSIAFLSKHIFRSFTLAGDENAGVHYDLEGFRSLNLQTDDGA